MGPNQWLSPLPGVMVSPGAVLISVPRKTSGRPKVRKQPLVEQWLQPLDRLTPFPALLDITAEQLRQAIRRAPSGKASGSDGWRYSELKAWPLPLIQQLCHVCHLVERTGKWPRELSTSLVALLPKGSSGQLDDYRPIVLLSAIYRLWVGLRMRTFRGWLPANKVLALKTQGGAESLAYDLALRMTAARAMGTAVSGLGLDWSKCYDHVHVGILEAIRILAAIAGPMLSAYRQPRRIVLKNLGGDIRSPDNGIPAGCPGATDWLALLMHLLTQPLAGIDSSVVVRAYVDDITADITGTEGVASVGRHLAEVTVEFGKTLCLVPNLDKSCLFSTDPEVRKELRGGAFPVVDTFKDLGVIQTPSGIPDQRLARARDQGGVDKLVRTGQVPVPSGDDARSLLPVAFPRRSMALPSKRSPTLGCAHCVQQPRQPSGGPLGDWPLRSSTGFSRRSALTPWRFPLCARGPSLLTPSSEGSFRLARYSGSGPPAKGLRGPWPAPGWPYPGLG